MTTMHLRESEARVKKKKRKRKTKKHEIPIGVSEESIYTDSLIFDHVLNPFPAANFFLL